MKHKIKSLEEIKKTLDENSYIDNIYFAHSMERKCGEEFEEVQKSSHGYPRCKSWTWHPDWLEGVKIDEF